MFAGFSAFMLSKMGIYCNYYMGRDGYLSICFFANGEFC